jgi:L-seryl-tRNA(Ser) seleniumtransferase
VCIHGRDPRLASHATVAPHHGRAVKAVSSRLRAIPAVEKVLHGLGDLEVPRPIAVEIVRRELRLLRSGKAIPGEAVILERIRSRLGEMSATRIRPLINATGILVHTNFGRAPLGRDALAAVSAIGSGYSNLEYDLVEGNRGRRAVYLEQALALLCAAQAATVVNNNAASLVLILQHFCRPPRRDVVISRGELVQIGGGFRIPDVLEASGAHLREIGTTNQTSLDDYRRAIGRETALVLKVHRSNFFMEGFVDSPPTDTIAALARRRRVPFVEDLGSGALVDTRTRHLDHEPTPAEVLHSGVDLVCFSGDKLLGGPQAGIIAGRSPLVAALKREPIFRALRCDKLTLSALEATVEAYLNGKPETIPVVGMMSCSIDELRDRAERIVASLGAVPVTARVGSGRAQIGGGTLPRSAMPSVTVELAHDRLKPQELAGLLRRQAVPIVGYVARGILKLDLRTVFPQQDLELVAGIRSACSR